jgi:hypothetical protein
MHLNAKRDDNKVENLRWGTAKENSAQMVADGNGPKSKRISDAMRKEIISSKETNSWWAEKIGCDRSYISHIRSGRRLSGQRRV